jgi:hypothetical protein
LIIACTIFPQFDAIFRKVHKITSLPEVAQLVEAWLVEVAGSIPDGVMAISLLNSSARTTALGSTQPLKEISTMNNISWGGKGGRCVGLTTLALSCADYLEILGALSSWNPKILSRPLY